jgi:hypothetical protein
MLGKNILKKMQKEVGAKIDIFFDSNNDHSRYQVNKKNIKRCLLEIFLSFSPAMKMIS